MRVGLACLAVTALVIVGVWNWLGAAIPVPPSPVGSGEKLFCVSYAPFRGTQTPLDLNTRISAAQIDEDMARLAKVSNCVRTYSNDFGLDQVPGIAARYGLKVLQGLWLSSHPERNKVQTETAVRLANQYPGVVTGVVVGNEVILRGELAAADVINALRQVKAQVRVPVTYADVWEFWLRNRDIAVAADFVTIHILPYWEDFPIPAAAAGEHVRAIRQKVADAFPGKEVIIGEVGWPSAGRMREGALPSPANQAGVIQDVLALAKRDNFKVNVIEAFDAPWKRALEGTVGGHWGLYFDASREAKFAWGEPVSNHPSWRWQAVGGAVFALIVFAAGFLAGTGQMTTTSWLAVAVNAMAGGILVGWAVENAPLESLGAGGWARSVAMLATGIASPVLFSAAIARGATMPSLVRLIGPETTRTTEPLTRAMAAVLAVTVLVSLFVALGLVFDPRYRDFPFAPLTATAVPLLIHSFTVKRSGGPRGTAELAASAILAASVIYIVPNESLANWQSLWVCAALAAIALTLFRVRDARS